MKRLVFLKADFHDPEQGDRERYFCIDCVTTESLLSCHPRLMNEFDVHRLNFVRPWQILADLPGIATILVLGVRTFISDTKAIIWHLTDFHKVGHRH